MEDAFNKLKVGKQNSVDNLIKWMKDSKLIDSTKEAEEKVRKLFSDVKDQKDVELDKFKEVVAKIAEEQTKTVNELSKMLSDAAKLIDESQAAEEKARKLFADVKDARDVELERFKLAVSKLAEQQKKTVEELSKMLSEEGPKLLNAVSAGLSSAVTAGATAFKDALSKK